MTRRVLFYAQNLLGVGHLQRAATLARAMAGVGLDVHVTAGCPPGLSAAVEVAHAVTRDAVRLTGRWYESRLVDGLSDGQYVEIVGTVVALVSIDQFCRAVAVPEHPLPAPLPRAPTRYRRPCLTAP